MTNTEPPRPLTDADYEELVEIWRNIKALRSLLVSALPVGAPGAWLREGAKEALDLEYRRLNRLYAETHPTLPTMEP